MYQKHERSPLRAFYKVFIALFLMGCDSSFANRLMMDKCYRFEYAGQKGHFMRHRGFKLYKEKGSGPLYDCDSRFRVVHPRTGTAVFEHAISLRSLNFLSHFVRHLGYKGYISKNSGSSIYRHDSTWNHHELSRSSNVVVLESVNFPYHYLGYDSSNRVQINRKLGFWVFHEVSCVRSFFDCMHHRG